RAERAPRAPPDRRACRGGCRWRRRREGGARRARRGRGPRRPRRRPRPWCATPSYVLAPLDDHDAPAPRIEEMFGEREHVRAADPLLRFEQAEGPFRRAEHEVVKADRLGLAEGRLEPGEGLEFEAVLGADEVHLAEP